MTSFHACSSSSCWVAWAASVERWWPASSWSRSKTSSAWSGHRCGHRSPSLSCSWSCSRYARKDSSVSPPQGLRDGPYARCAVGVGPRYLPVVPGGGHQSRLSQYRRRHVDLHGVCHVVEHVLGLFGLRRAGFGRFLRNRRLHHGTARESSAHGRRRGDVLARPGGGTRRDGGGAPGGCHCVTRASSHVR